MIRTKMILTGLHHLQFEFLFDKKALKTLESTLGLTATVKYITKQTAKRSCIVRFVECLSNS